MPFRRLECFECSIDRVESDNEFQLGGRGMLLISMLAVVQHLIVEIMVSFDHSATLASPSPHPLSVIVLSRSVRPYQSLRSITSDISKLHSSGHPPPLMSGWVSNQLWTRISTAPWTVIEPVKPGIGPMSSRFVPLGRENCPQPCKLNFSALSADAPTHWLRNPFIRCVEHWIILQRCDLR